MSRSPLPRCAHLFGAPKRPGATASAASCVFTLRHTKWRTRTTARLRSTWRYVKWRHAPPHRRTHHKPRASDVNGQRYTVKARSRPRATVRPFRSERQPRRLAAASTLCRSHCQRSRGGSRSPERSAGRRPTRPVGVQRAMASLLGTAISCSSRRSWRALVSRCCGAAEAEVDNQLFELELGLDSEVIQKRLRLWLLGQASTPLTR